MLPAQPHRALLVLGVHHGGTSAPSLIANLLGAAGPARPIPPGPDNPRGFREPQPVVRLNDRMLLLGRFHRADWTRFGPGRLPLAMQDALRPRLALPLLTPPALSTASCALLALRHPAAVCASLASHDAYLAFVLRGLAGTVTTSHVLVAQWDGWVSGPAAWNPALLEWDYIGAPWPSLDAAAGKVEVGAGGFSLRSRRLLDALAGLVALLPGAARARVRRAGGAVLPARPACGTVGKWGTGGWRSRMQA